jgi:CspA family cold shock protein
LGALVHNAGKKHAAGRTGPAAGVVSCDCISCHLWEAAMPTGNVKWFDSKKGFGFIINSEGKDVFVHFSSIEGDGFRSLKDGETVDYEQIQGEKGLLAQHVKRIVAKAGVPAASA